MNVTPQHFFHQQQHCTACCQKPKLHGDSIFVNDKNAIVEYATVEGLLLLRIDIKTIDARAQHRHQEDIVGVKLKCNKSHQKPGAVDW